MASTSRIGPLASPDWVPRSRSPESWGPTSPGPVPFSPPYIPRSPESTPGSTSPADYLYYPTSPGPVPPSPPYIPQSAEWIPGSVSPENYYPTSPGPGPQSPAYAPSSPQWGSKGTSPTNYYPTSPGPVPPSPPYVPRSPEWWSTSPTPAPQSPAYAPTSPQAGYRGTSPVKYYPTSPGTVPPSPPYVPQSPQWAFTSPTPVPLSPSSPATASHFDEHERELDGSWGRGRFVYTRARSILSEEEEEQRQRGEHETTTEPFPELPDWEEDERTEGKAEKDVQDVMVHEPAAAFPEEEEGGLPDYQYYEQLDQEEKGDAEKTAAETLMQLETQHSVADPYPDIAALNYEPAQSNFCQSYPSSEIGMHQSVEDKHANWISSCSSFHSSSAINNPACRVSQRLIGCVKVQKRVDRMMWNKLMQKKMVRMMEVCEKYVPADVLKGLKR
ncbi:hypothetical protein NEUTE1DRAFT_47767 [Neurospora tetrasperma FGSC 2508]|uniref:Uncharacterized protein n=1 Tax=Neurospora tetrasperma (strain FGSC 2508 / ATCC MYA-4615 / P0657) TaxID=510951 RepID=F8MSM7_NEUT8|nr:uncharacterized protein NEUTE1DRAFT_47767 [Neurospora tetrasperma FGSC 2508]EGO55114.1 hypothetical protein NEUTE1DRAFT_47767 [Neurospora tetrasperma FGSC 2508]EGZ69675.1 hypothetical protein NEUTE2DRAFT_132069 [Neurospora tetrasperma FGSC 2509]